MSLKRTMEFAKFVYDSEVRHTKFPVVIPVDVPDDLPKTTGTWRMISPEELIHSFLLKLQERIDQGADEEELNQWKKVALSYPAQFEVIQASGSGSGSDELYWEAWRNRQIMIQASDTVKRTARQLCWEVYGFKERKQLETGEVLTVAKLQEQYSKARTAESNRTEIQDNFVASALSIHEKLLSDSQINSALDTLEDKFGLAACFNSVTKLKILIEKTENAEVRRWVLNSIVDQIEAGALANEQATWLLSLILLILLFMIFSLILLLYYINVLLVCLFVHDVILATGDQSILGRHKRERKCSGDAQVQAEDPGLPLRG